MTTKDLTDAYVGIFAVVLLAVVYILFDEKKAPQLRKDFSDVKFVIFALIILAISIWGIFISKNKRIQTATRHAFIAFLIAYFAHLDMVFAAFFIVGILVYFTDKSGDDNPDKLPILK